MEEIFLEATLTRNWDEIARLCKDPTISFISCISSKKWIKGQKDEVLGLVCKNISLQKQNWLLDYVIKSQFTITLRVLLKWYRELKICISPDKMQDILPLGRGIFDLACECFPNKDVRFPITKQVELNPSVIGIIVQHFQFDIRKDRFLELQIGNFYSFNLIHNLILCRIKHLNLRITYGGRVSQGCLNILFHLIQKQSVYALFIDPHYLPELKCPNRFTGFDIQWTQPFDLSRFQLRDLSYNTPDFNNLRRHSEYRNMKEFLEYIALLLDYNLLNDIKKEVYRGRGLYKEDFRKLPDIQSNEFTRMKSTHCNRRLLFAPFADLVPNVISYVPNIVNCEPTFQLIADMDLVAPIFLEFQCFYTFLRRMPYLDTRFKFSNQGITYSKC